MPTTRANSTIRFHLLHQPPSPTIIEAGRLKKAPFIIVVVFHAQRFITITGDHSYDLAANTGPGAFYFVTVEFVGVIAPMGLLRGASC